MIGSHVRRTLLVGVVLLGAFVQAPPTWAMTAQELSEQIRQAQMSVRRGQYTDAIRIYGMLMAEVPENDRVVRGYASALRQLGRYEDALDVYARGDAARPQPAFLLDRVRILKQLDRSRDALDLCLENLEASRALRLYLQEQTIELAESPLLWPVAYNRLWEKFRDRKTEAVGITLSEICLLGNRHEEAVTVSRELDRELRGGGDRLFGMARRLDALGDEALALEVVTEVIDDYPRSAYRQEAVILRASLEEALGDPDAAYRGLTDLIEEGVSDHRAFYELQMRRAGLLAGPLEQADGAIALYDTLLATPFLRRDFEAIRLQKAETQLRLERFAGALEDFRELARSSRKENVRERAEYLVGEIFFYQGELDSAAAAYARQVEAFPDGRLANDALDRIFLFNENYMVDGLALQAMGGMYRMSMRGEIEQAVVLGDSLAHAYADTDIHDDMLLTVGTLLSTTEAPERGVAYLDTLATRYPESRLAPLAMQLKGEIIEASDPSRALSVYEDLLIRYPFSLEASEVRPRVSRLRKELRS